jgi:ubiquinone/menaquinone biosynthesis C-methylase UbiE
LMLEKRKNTILDFGCGSGRILFRCLTYGADNVIGIDISKKGIELAHARARRFKLEDRMQFIVGGVEKIAAVRKVIDGAVLFNIVDNLLPRDAKKAVHDFTEKLRVGGRILLKMSDYFDRRILVEKDGAEEIGPNSYKEKTGLFYFNLTDREIESLFGAFKVCQKQRIKLSEDNVWNRLWHFEKAS